ncbi:SDR family NAD(P)-dependent oxidoreductase [uncultured Abyssibacter sp.]|uniref:SDR family oxidoreductase n=1 Tax=uncultured Abyssibacter sp. TaxID=2320202 RepID=UPI0032B12BEB
MSSRVIVITGAGVGLGRALARRFVADGEQVVLLGRTAAKVEAVAEELGEAAMAIGCDVASPESVNAAFALIAERHGRIDDLINNAAIYEPFTVAEAADEQILNIVNTNLSGAIFCARAAIGLLNAGGHIINVSSESVGMTFPMLNIYAAAKAGLERFGEGLRHELEPDGIRVTNVRAGQMYEEGKTWDIDPGVAGRFMQATMAVGLNLRERPISHYNSVTDVFRNLLDLPPDVQVGTMHIGARRPA